MLEEKVRADAGKVALITAANENIPDRVARETAYERGSPRPLPPMAEILLTR